MPEAFTGYLGQQDKVNFNVNAFPNGKFIAQVKRLAGALIFALRSQRIEMDVANEKIKNCCPVWCRTL